MKNNVYIYVILVALITGIFAGVIGYEHFGNAQKQRVDNELMAKTIESKKQEKFTLNSEIQNLAIKRRTLQTEVREIAGAIIEKENVLAEYRALDEKLRQSVQLQGIKLKINQEGVSAMQDQIAEDTTAIERSSQNMKAIFDLDRQKLELRQKHLDSEAEVEAREKARRLSSLDTNIDTANISLSRVNSLSVNQISDPWIVGEVLGFNSSLNKVVINLGRAAGIQQNFKFCIFSSDEGNRRAYKGFVIVKEVDELVSTGVLEVEGLSTLIPVVGDKIGSFVYRRDKLTFFLGGEYRANDLRMPSKFTKEQLKSRLEFMGNKVSSELSSDVDIFIEGSLAQDRIQKATNLGISILPVNLLMSYFGE